MPWPWFFPGLVSGRRGDANLCRIGPEVNAGPGKALAAHLHDLEAVAEGVVDKEAALTLDLIIGTRSVAGVSTSGSDSIDILYVKGDVGFLRGTKLRIDAAGHRHLYVIDAQNDHAFAPR